LESGIVKNLRVVWICHFSNKEVQDILKPWKRVKEMAPWIPSLAKTVEQMERIELHIVSPHEYIPNYCHFILRGVHYHFFNPHIPFWGRHWPRIFKLDYWSGFFLNKMIMNKLINKIQPDIIHLHGAENAYYSSTIYQFHNKYPVLVTLQGFLFKIRNLKENYQSRIRIKHELKIYRTFRHFGIRTVTMGNVIKEINPKAVLHWHGYGIKINITDDLRIREKKFDLVYFARIDKSKGIEDFLMTIHSLKKNKKDISALVIGSTSSNYMKKLLNICLSLDITDNITWAGFLPSQTDVHKAASEAKISVLPVQYDMIPGTIIESMLLRIPVVAYNVGSIHEINDKEEIISLVEKNNIDGLTKSIEQLLDNVMLQMERAEKGYKRAEELLDHHNVLNDLLKAYYEVLEDC